MNDQTSDSVTSKMEETLDVIRQVNEQLKDAVRITVLLIEIVILSSILCESVES